MIRSRLDRSPGDSPQGFHIVIGTARLHVPASRKFGQGNSREQSCAAVPRSGGGCAVPGLWGLTALRRQGRVRGRGRPSGGTEGDTPGALQTHQTLGISPHLRRNTRQSALFRPWAAPESPLPRPPRRRHPTAESSCGAPMHAASLTKGYGGNPPSGRSVSPPRTGPFFCAREQPAPRRRERPPRRPASPSLSAPASAVASGPGSGPPPGRPRGAAEAPRPRSRGSARPRQRGPGNLANAFPRPEPTLVRLLPAPRRSPPAPAPASAPRPPSPAPATVPAGPHLPPEQRPSRAAVGFARGDRHRTEGLTIT